MLATRPRRVPSLRLVGNPVSPSILDPQSSVFSSGLWPGTHVRQRWAPADHVGLSSATRLGRPVSSLTSNGLCGDGSFLQAPLTPGTQGLLPLHLRGRVLCRHQGLCSWGQRITSFGAIFMNDRQLDVLGVRSTADSTGQGRAQGSWVSLGNYGEPPGAEGPGSREAIDIQDKGVGQATK